MRKLCVAILVAFVPAAAVAQMDWINPMIESQRFKHLVLDNNPRLNPAVRARSARVPPRASGEAAVPNELRASAGAALQSSNTAFTFESTSASRRSALDGYLQRVARSDPATGQALAEQFRRHDAFSIYDQVTAPFGIRPNDAADALTAYSVLGYLIAAGAGDPTRAQVAGVRRQIAARMASDRRLADPVTRAAFGEEMKLVFVTLHTGWKSAMQDGALPQFQRGVGIMFAQQGTDFSKLRLTDVGYVSR